MSCGGAVLGQISLSCSQSTQISAAKLLIFRMAGVFYRKTPLIRGKDILNTKVLLKLEHLQVSGSFKDRGISHMIQTLAVAGVTTKVICSSGGNAGNAVASAGSKLNIPVDVYVPTTTMPLMIEKIKNNPNTRVFVQGDNWNAANIFALNAMKEAGSDSNNQGQEGTSPHAIYVPPYDDPLIWEGNSTIIDEILEDCNGDLNQFPSVIVLSVGGGGLLRGVQLGLERLGLVNKTEIYAVETEGSACFNAAKNAGEVVRLSSIDSIATSLGALSCVEDTLNSPVKTTSFTVTDTEALDACYEYADEFRTLVEPACGAALALAKRTELFDGLDSAAFIVCGGQAINMKLLETYREKIKIIESKFINKKNK
jgi:L-serine/L-threonine ammonia-lyase